MINNIAFQFTKILYVDDINLMAINQGKEIVEEVIARSQLILDA